MKNFIIERGITSLYHFTFFDNLKNILEKGLLTRKTMDRYHIPYEYNDNFRMDERLDATSLSISFPNYKMFYKCRQNSQKLFCVIELDPSILYEKECIFCIENAASRNEKLRSNYEKVGRNGIEQLFYDNNLRKRLGISKNYTTNPQAEVLVIDDIEVKYIKNVFFDVYEIDLDIKKYKDIGFYYEKSLFTYRSDYEYWR